MIFGHLCSVARRVCSSVGIELDDGHIPPLLIRDVLESHSQAVLRGRNVSPHLVRCLPSPRRSAARRRGQFRNKLILISRRPLA